jgi:hypothetical protein
VSADRFFSTKQVMRLSFKEPVRWFQLQKSLPKRRGSTRQPPIFISSVVSGLDRTILNGSTYWRMAVKINNEALNRKFLWILPISDGKTPSD